MIVASSPVSSALSLPRAAQAPLPAPGAPAAPVAPTPPGVSSGMNFEEVRDYVQTRFEEAQLQLGRALAGLDEHVPAGPVLPGSERASHYAGIVAATMAAAAAVQEGVLWYGELRSNATLPDEFTARERPVLAHVMTGIQGVTRAEGFIRAILEVGQSPIDDEMWREQAWVDADDAARWVGQARLMVDAMVPRPTA